MTTDATTRRERRRAREAQVLSAFPATAVLSANEVANRLPWGRNHALVHQTLTRLVVLGYMVELESRGPRCYRLARGEDT